MMDLLQNFSDHFFENGALSALIAFVVIVGAGPGSASRGPSDF